MNNYSQYLALYDLNSGPTFSLNSRYRISYYEGKRYAINKRHNITYIEHTSRPFQEGYKAGMKEVQLIKLLTGEQDGIRTGLQ